jgi:catechol 2,3-dioxygenase-like lactoylglutathione lyase family enzyme
MSGIRSRTGWWGIALDGPDPLALAHFYRDLFGWEIANEEADWVTMGVPGTTSYLAFKPESVYERPTWPAAAGRQQMMMHLDIGVSDLDAAVDDALALGAELAEFQPQDDVRVLLDPAGHPFCLYTDTED